MDLAIVGAGVIGMRRAEDAVALGHRVVWVADINRDRAQSAAQLLGARPTVFWHEAVDDPEVQVVIASATNKISAEVAIAALSREKHVLIEGPMGRSSEEAALVLSAARERGKGLHAGFNYRYYPGIREAYAMVQEGKIGKLLYARVLFGHGAYPGYENDWKLDPEQCGGGVLLDLGVHCVDLFRWFLGELWDCSVVLRSDFWKKGTDDNAFLTFRSADGRAAIAHLSLTMWENTFSLELGGTEGMIRVSGRSKHYGAQRLRLIPRWSWKEAPDGRVRVYEKNYPSDDRSYREELQEFLARIQENPARVDGYDGFRATDIVDRIYHVGEGLVDLKPKNIEPPRA